MPSGRPDWFGTIVAAGKYDDTYIPITLDEFGFITAKMKGVYDSLLKTIAVDSGGVIKANLFVQDLEELVTRPKYGTGQQSADTGNVDPSTPTSLISVPGKGVLYFSVSFIQATGSIKNDSIQLLTDGNLYLDETFGNLQKHNLALPAPGSFWMPLWDENSQQYVICFGYGVTFETSLQIKYIEFSGRTPSVNTKTTYALIT